jgi:phage/plasmid-associated DNA primase
MFSNYGYKMPSSLIQNPLKTGPNTEVANLHRKRFALTQEPDGNKRCCTSTIKELTGDTTINARGLYDSNTERKICATFVMECNVNPRLDEITEAVVRRIRVIPFNTRAVDQSDYDVMEDKTGYVVKNELYASGEYRIEHRQALFAILCRYFAKFLVHKYPVQPIESKKLTSEYMASSDDFYLWFSSEYQISEDKCEPIKTRELLDDFKNTGTYHTLSKNQQREYTATRFNKLVTDSVFLRKYFKDRKEYYSGNRLASPSICGWVRIPKDESVNLEDGYTDDGDLDD